jgi:hypothetical protein
MLMLTRRLQILLDDERYARLAAEAARRKVSVATVVREAIDDAFPGSRVDRQALAARILRAPKMPVPDPPALREELAEVRARRR